MTRTLSGSFSSFLCHNFSSFYLPVVMKVDFILLLFSLDSNSSFFYILFRVSAFEGYYFVPFICFLFAAPCFSQFCSLFLPFVVLLVGPKSISQSVLLPLSLTLLFFFFLPQTPLREKEREIVRKTE